MPAEIDFWQTLARLLAVKILAQNETRAIEFEVTKDLMEAIEWPMMDMDTYYDDTRQTHRVRLLYAKDKRRPS